MLHRPILSDIGVTDFKGLSLGFGDVSDPHVVVGGIVYGPGPPDPQLGDTLGLPIFFRRTLNRDLGNPSRGPGVCWSGQLFWMTVCRTPGGMCPSPGHTGWAGFC